MVRLSALVCVQNQDARLSECLRKLSFCDEIVVVADRCTDRSQDVARRQGAIVIDGIFPLESQRKAAGVEACSGDWILEIDPDELVDAALAWEVRAVLQMRPAGDWYELPIDNYVGETLVREGWAGALSSRAEPRLYKRGLKAWEPRRLNAPAVMAGRSGGALTGAIRRSLGRDVGGLLERLNRLTALAAEDLADAGRPVNLASGLLAGAATFLRGYVGRGGWREGRVGLLVAMLSAMFPVLSQMRASDVLEARNTAVAEATRASRMRDVVGLAAR
ncbi:MAG: glycosyltransferase family 2 protein [Phenylobacterium sp.]|uniref:glycosyltransferase family 2 protein n=1 Tax=Phenylobacterium sp. TaxID=1871053 RepID=UPI0011FB8F30|nr:glycosyltransferase family 2 protein [Phenylobacterium sp.]TAJ70659.1 MAG: glycosyltransferase family 2 protein [Phenylobacterium sp.]